MDMSKKQAEFFTILIVICTVTAALILAIDFQIKGAILEESTRMRKDIERYLNGQRSAPANGRGPFRNSDNDPAYPSDLVASGTTGVEETSNIQNPNGTGTSAARRRPKPRAQDGPGIVPDSGK